MRLKKDLCGTAALLGFLAALGCQRDDIRAYDADKEPIRQRTSAAAPRVEERMLAAQVPNGDAIWFFKMQGPVAEVSKHKAEFDSVLRSVRFAPQQADAVDWTTPAGWKREAGNEIRYATLRPEGEEKIELWITKLPPSDLLTNVNRWRGQLSLPPITAAELPKETISVHVAGVDATMVDITGMTSGKMPPFAGHGKMPPFAGMNEPADGDEPVAKLPFTYTLPSGWRFDPRPRRMRLATFEVTDGGESAEVAVSSFEGDVGGRLGNVQHWRDQLKLPRVDERELSKGVQEFDVAGEKAYAVDLAAAADGGKDQQRMLAVGLPHAGETWFFRMTGPVDLVGKQKAAFEAFVRSVKIDGGKGAKP